VDKVDNSRHNGLGEGRCENPIVGVRDTKRPSVGDKTGVFFWEEKKKTKIKTRGRVMAFAHSIKNGEEEGGGEVGGGPPRCKRNTVRTGCRIVFLMERRIDSMVGIERREVLICLL